MTASTLTPSTASHASTTGPRSMASPITVVPWPVGARGCSKKPSGRGGRTSVVGYTRIELTSA